MKFIKKKHVIGYLYVGDDREGAVAVVRKAKARGIKNIWIEKRKDKEDYRIAIKGYTYSETLAYVVTRLINLAVIRCGLIPVYKES